MKQSSVIAAPLMNESQPFNEEARLAELRTLNILDTPPNKYFDRYTKLIAEIFNVPMVAISLIDENRQWFKSSVGIGVSETPREKSFCTHFLDRNVLEVPDTVENSFFCDHPIVVGSPFIRFYMGIVLRGPTGQPLGTLYIMDTQSRYLSREQYSWLETFSLLVQELINHNHAAPGDSDEKGTEISHHDKVTGLPDTKLFSNTLKHLIHLSQEEEKHLAILHLRLNKVDEIKQVHGQPTCNAFLRCFADRLIADDTKVLAAGHLSQSQFGAVIHLSSLYNLFDVITPIANKLTSSMELEEMMIRPDIDIGISLSPLDGQTPNDLMERARTSMDGPKSHAGMYIFSHEVEKTALRRHTIAQHLEVALHNKELIKHYQPLITVDGSRIVGFEALARWHNPELGHVSPADFVPIAEQDPRLSRQLTEWSLTMVCGEVPKWPFRPGDPSLRIAVNIPPGQFHEPGFVDRVLGTLEEHHLAPERLTLELTEESILANVDKSIQAMCEFRSHGITIALDDFGTGYSSLSKLKDLPLDILKIDKSFIDNITHDARAANLVGGIIHIAHGLGLKVVAEGVEHEQQRAILQAFGCDVVQGYLFSRPVLPDGAVELLKNWPHAS
ncbi:EAL domain-containing protein [Halomonas sp. CH40]